MGKLVLERMVVEFLATLRNRGYSVSFRVMQTVQPCWGGRRCDYMHWHSHLKHALE